MKSSTIILWAIFLLLLPIYSVSQQVYFTNGFKASELTDQEVIIWTRLCASPTPKPVVHSRANKVFRHPVEFDENMPVDKMDGAVAGSPGWVKMTISSASKKMTSPWIAVTGEKDFTAYHHFKNLQPNTTYTVRIQGKRTEKASIQEITGSFKTAPDPMLQKELNLTTSTCQYFWSYDDSLRGFQTYLSMKAMNPDLFIQTGDYVYYDKPGPMATTVEKARHKWHAMDAWSSLKEFYAATPVYLLKDDHDLLENDVHQASKPFGALTLKNGLDIWQENVPLRDKPYRTLQWGKDLQIWFLEGREYRSDNDMPDGKDKTIWGEAQKQWMEKTIGESKATFKIVFSPTPIVGPDRGKKADNHANAAFQSEGDWARDFLARNKVIVVNGDRHWQYVSRDPKTGLWEFSSGPVSDFHAQGWPPNEKRPEHRFLRVAGGYLGIRLIYKNNFPQLILTHYDVKGEKVHEETLDRLAIQQPFVPNYDESKVGNYSLPDALKKEDGSSIQSAKEWEEYRSHWIGLFEKTMFGKMPKNKVKQNSTLISKTEIMDGKAIQYIWKLVFEDKHTVTMLGVLPNTEKKVPVFIGLNFCGNQTTFNHPAIPLYDKYVICNDGPGFNDHLSLPASRGLREQRWQFEKIIEAGMGSITIACGDFEEDHPEGYKRGIRNTLKKELGLEAEEWSAIGAWAWGLSRAVDFLETQPMIDNKKIVVHGHSRLGKTALWAGATDQRFAAVISNESGEGGAAITRRNYGENLWRITHNFPHWFVKGYKDFAYRENDLPFDQHILLSLVAPRPLYVGSAVGDQWSDPKGEFLGAKNTTPVYRLYNKKGLDEVEFPSLHVPVGDDVRYHIREGKHDMVLYDWMQYIQFAKEKVF